MALFIRLTNVTRPSRRPIRDKEPQDDVPYGVHPVIDLIKLVGTIADQQYILALLMKRNSRILALCCAGWFLLAVAEVLRWTLR